MSEKDANAKITSAEVEDTDSVSWTAPITPVFEDKFVRECNIQRSGETLELWHNPVTGAYDLRPVGGN